jgi:hypothetical protein
MLLGQGYRAPRGAVIDEYEEIDLQGNPEELGENSCSRTLRPSRIPL